MNDIERLLDELIEREGSYVDHPNDRGGPTKYGITQAAAIANGYNGPMRDLRIEFAKQVYKKKYWTGPGFDKIAALGLPMLAEELFDTGVNMGPPKQVAWLQRWLNALCGQYPSYVHIAPDGVAGNGTRAALEYLIKKRGLELVDKVLTKAVNCSQGAAYLELTEAREKNNAFTWGWIVNRVEI